MLPPQGHGVEGVAHPGGEQIPEQEQRHKSCVDQIDDAEGADGIAQRFRGITGGI